MIYKKKDQIQNFQILQEHFLWRVINVKEITSRKKNSKIVNHVSGGARNLGQGGQD